MRQIAPLTVFLLAGTCAHAASPAYTLSKTIALGAPDHWDYVAYDARSNRVLVAHSDHTDVVDGGSGAIIGKLTGLNGAHGQAVAADGTIWADSGKSAHITPYDPKTFIAGNALPAGMGADAVVADPSGQTIAVMDGDAKTATLIDTASRRVKSIVPLDGEPEFASSDKPGRFYINLASTSEIVVLDAGLGRVTARYAVPDCESPHGSAIDPKTRRLFASCVNARLIVLDADNGHVLQTLPIGHGTDAAAFDPVHNLVFSSNGEGTLSVFHESADGALTALGDIKTAPGARTMAVDPQSGRVFLVTADLASDTPKQGPHGPRWSYKPGTVKLLFLDPAPK